MAIGIKISTRRYESIFRHKPEGYGLWYFLLPGGRVFAYAGQFQAACHAVAAHAQAARYMAPVAIQLSA